MTPSFEPSNRPTVSHYPSSSPTTNPTMFRSSNPSIFPSSKSSQNPSETLSSFPSYVPSVFIYPTRLPSKLQNISRTLVPSYTLSRSSSIAPSSGLLLTFQNASVTVRVSEAPERLMNETEKQLFISRSLDFVSAMHGDDVFMTTMEVFQTNTESYNEERRSLHIYNSTYDFLLVFYGYCKPSENLSLLTDIFFASREDAFVDMIKSESGLGLIDGTYFVKASIDVLVDVPSIRYQSLQVAMLFESNSPFELNSSLVSSFELATKLFFQSSVTDIVMLSVDAAVVNQYDNVVVFNISAMVPTGTDFDSLVIEVFSSGLDDYNDALLSNSVLTDYILVNEIRALGLADFPSAVLSVIPIIKDELGANTLAGVVAAVSTRLVFK